MTPVVRLAEVIASAIVGLAFAFTTSLMITMMMMMIIVMKMMMMLISLVRGRRTRREPLEEMWKFLYGQKKDNMIETEHHAFCSTYLIINRQISRLVREAYRHLWMS